MKERKRGTYFTKIWYEHSERYEVPADQTTCEVVAFKCQTCGPGLTTFTSESGL